MEYSFLTIGYLTWNQSIECIKFSLTNQTRNLCNSLKRSQLINLHHKLNNISEKKIWLYIIIIIYFENVYFLHTKLGLAFSLRQLSIPGNIENKVLVAGCSSWHQPARIREETLESGNLFSSSWICLRTVSASVPYIIFYYKYSYYVTLPINFIHFCYVITCAYFY